MTVKDHEWPLDGSPSSGGEIHSPGIGGRLRGLGQDRSGGLETFRLLA